MAALFASLVAMFFFSHAAHGWDYETNYKGSWELVVPNAGISAMHLIVRPNNKAVMFDSTSRGPSQLLLPKGQCRKLSKGKKQDCTAHAAEFDIQTNAIRPLKIETDTWCSMGGLNEEGILVQAGGWMDGGKVARYLELCDTCDWKEYPNTLSGQRWYSTQQILPDGSFIVVGGRRMFSYEFIPAPGKSNNANYYLQLLKETTDISENNLYPHVHLSTDGNLFIFANYRSILFNPKYGNIIREFPDLPGGARNYPGSASSALLPLKLSNNKNKTLRVQVVICGGTRTEAFRSSDKKKIFLPALQTCGRISLTDVNSTWRIITMPGPRVMADMLILPTGDLLMINGAKKGTSGWEDAEDPYYNPVLYKPTKRMTEQFEELNPTTIPRMYHSTSAVLPDGKILVAGSNTHKYYNYTAKYPTELRMEKFSPPYLDPKLSTNRLSIATNFSNRILTYGEEFELDIEVYNNEIDCKSLKVTMYSPPFTTHGYSMNQRLVVLAKKCHSRKNGTVPYRISLTAPPNGAVAPPGYYMLFVVHHGLPSKAVWVKLSNHLSF